jgi:hypothetical protein
MPATSGNLPSSSAWCHELLVQLPSTCWAEVPAPHKKSLGNDVYAGIDEPDIEMSGFTKVKVIRAKRIRFMTIPILN